MKSSVRPSTPAPNAPANFYAARALSHVEHLAGEIGARPSTGEGERRAAAYVAGVLREAGLQNVRTETFRGAPSTYRPYLLAFGAATVSTLVHALRPSRATASVAALSHASAAFGFTREATLKDNWLRRALPTAESSNVIGIVPPRGEVKKRVVVFGHLDSHRTPIFYSSPTWLRWFSRLVALGFAGLVLGAFVHALVAALGEKTRAKKILKLLETASTLLKGGALALMAHADTTPFSPGANDNASGAATMLALAERAAQSPLKNTELWFLANGCEEVGCYGIKAFLEAHGEELREASFLDFDMVGIGAPTLLTREGLLLANFPNAKLLETARRVARENPDLIAGEHEGGAYTDTGMVTALGFAGLTIDSQRPKNHPAEKFMGYWHQMQDTPEKLELECLARTHEFGWQLIQALDREDKTQI